MSSWSNEAMFNIKSPSKKGKAPTEVVDKVYRVNMADREELVETIVGLR